MRRMFRARVLIRSRVRRRASTVALARIQPPRMGRQMERYPNSMAIEDERFLQVGPPDLTKLYRPYRMNMSKRWTREHRVLFKELDFASKLEENWCKIEFS
jgi:hypothetical protein